MKERLKKIWNKMRRLWLRLLILLRPLAEVVAPAAVAPTGLGEEAESLPLYQANGPVHHL